MLCYSELQKQFTENGKQGWITKEMRLREKGNPLWIPSTGQAKGEMQGRYRK